MTFIMNAQVSFSYHIINPNAVLIVARMTVDNDCKKIRKQVRYHS